MSLTTTEAKHAARILARELAESHDCPIAHSRALELVAHQLGYADWNVASARLAASPEPSAPATGAAVPVLRVQDARIAYGFYRDYLGFAVQWEHRFEPGLPLYARLRRGETMLDLSEHHGDGTPGSVVWIPVAEVHALQQELAGRPDAPIRPGVDPDAPGGPTLEVIDPYGNILRFCQPSGSG